MENLLGRIYELYGIKLLFLERVQKGYLSENNVLYDGDIKFFLKKYRFDNEEKVLEVHSVKKYFSDGGVPVILPLSTKEGRTFFHFDGEFYAIFPFISDIQTEGKNLTDSDIISLAEMLGKMHLLGKSSELPLKSIFKPWDKEKTLKEISLIETEIQKISQPSGFDTDALKGIQVKKNLILKDSLVYEDFDLPSDHLIHGDYLEHNVFFDKNNKVSHVFDFEKAEYCPRTQELLRSMIYIFFNGGINEKGFKNARRYIDSYSDIYPIPKDELARGLKMFYTKSFHRVWVESEHYLKNNKRVDLFLKMDNYRIGYLLKNYEEFEKRIIL
ncbi:MAG: phosphotransferase [Candidatus Parcubacteria bacterium]|nr:phosphotransferase [Candidatus Parcubacteria bacterium]